MSSNPLSAATPNAADLLPRPPQGFSGGVPLPQDLSYPRYFKFEGQRAVLCGYGACDPAQIKSANQFQAHQSSRVWIESETFVAGGDIVFLKDKTVTAFTYGPGESLVNAGNTSGRVGTEADTSANAGGTMASSKLCQFLIFGAAVTIEGLFQYAATDDGDFHPAWLSPKSFDYYERTVAALARNLTITAKAQQFNCEYQLRTVAEQPSLFGVRGADQLQIGSFTGFVPYITPIAWMCSGSDVQQNAVTYPIKLPIRQEIQNVAANPTVVGPGSPTGVVSTLKLHTFGMTVGLSLDTICGQMLG